MRKEPFLVEDYVHVYNRGNRKMPIVYDDSDKWRFLKILRYFNNNASCQNAFRELDSLIKSGECRRFEWPKEWLPQRPLVKIISYHLSPNHYHLLLKEVNKGGISKFMKKLGDGFTGYINTKYNESGSLFQGSYKAKTVKDQRGLGYLDAYIQVFNAFELNPRGIEGALENFEEAFKLVLKYPFCSLGENFGKRNLHIVDRDVLGDMFPDIETYKEFVRDALIVRNIREIIKEISFD